MPTPTCQGSLDPHAPCRLFRTQANQPKQIRGPCRFCHERRCRAHCKCARTSTLTGHQGSRDNPKAGARAKPMAKAQAARSPPPAPPAVAAEAFPLRPRGRPPETSVQVLTTVAWIGRLLEDAAAAGEILVASYTYDHASLTALLVRRLGSRSPPDVVVMVDEEMFLARSCFRMRPRLNELRRLGAQVYLCRGTPPRGAFHTKAVCVDRRYLYAGSANLTDKALSANVETVFRLTGAPVVDVLATLHGARARAKLWGGVA